MYRFYCNPKWVRGVWSKVADVARQQTIYISLRLFWAEYCPWKSNVGHFEPITIICFQKNAEKHPCLTTSFRPWNHFCVLQLRWWSNFIDNTYTKFHGYIDTKYTGKMKYQFAGSNLSTLAPRSTDPCHGFYGLKGSSDPFYSWNQCRKESVPTYNDSEFKSRHLQSILSRSGNSI